MQPFQRPQFICSAIEMCQETAQCCPHKQPHIKDERCVPRECRYALGAESIDCVPYVPEKPNVPVSQPVEPVTETVLEQKPLPSQRPIEYKEGPKTEVAKDAGKAIVPQEETIKEAVKKKAQKKGPSRKKVQ